MSGNGLHAIPSLDELLADPAKVTTLPLGEAKVLWLELITLEKAVAMSVLLSQQSDQGEPPKKNALTAKQVAGILNVKLSFVHEMARQGKLKSYKLGKHRRFKEAAVNDYLAKNGA